MKKPRINLLKPFFKKLIIFLQILLVLSVVGLIIWSIYLSIQINMKLCVNLVDQHLIQMMENIDQNLQKACSPELLKYNLGKVSFIADVSLVPENVRRFYESVHYSIPGSLVEGFDEISQKYFVKVKGTEEFYYAILKERQDVEFNSVTKFFLYKESLQPRYFEVSTLFIESLKYFKPM
jgi:hypothetical protein